MMACCRSGDDNGEAEGETAHILPPALVVVVNPTTDSLDKPRKRRKLSKKVVVSGIACFSWVSMGGLQGLLGPAIPAIAKHLAVPDTSLGWAFTVRAGGYITGSLLISRLREDGGQRPSKVMIMACAGLLASVVNVAIPHSTGMLVLLFLCFLQGIGLSIISTLGNIVLLEIWGPKAGPWLQGLHFSFGMGAILSSLILGVSGMSVSFNVFACVGMLPFVAVVLVEGLPRWRGKKERKNTIIVVEEDEEGREEGEGWKTTTRQFCSNSTKDMQTILEGAPTGAGREEGRGGVDDESNNDNDCFLLAPLPVPAKEDLEISSSSSLPSSASASHRRQSSTCSSSSSSQQQQQQHQRHGSRGGSRRLSLTIMPFQETIMALATVHHHHPHHEQQQQQQQQYQQQQDNDEGDEEEAMLCSGAGGGASLLERVGRSESTGAPAAAAAARATRGESAAWGGGKEGREGGREGGFLEKEGPQEVTIATDLNMSLSNTAAAAAAAAHHHHHQQHQQQQYQQLESHIGVVRSRHDSLSSSTSSSSSSSSSSPSTKTLPLPSSIKWLLSLFLGLYVGGECGFGGWISTFVLLEGATTSVSQAAFLVSIFWAAVTIGRAVAVGQALLVGPSWSLRLQLFISLCGATAFYVLGAESFKGAAMAAAIFGYGMSSVYPLGMSWPGEAGFALDTASTAHLVVGGCVGEAAVPLVIGGMMQLVGPQSLPLSILGMVLLLVLALITVEILGRRAKREVEAGREGEVVEQSMYGAVSVGA